MENINRPAPRWQFLALIPALVIAAALLAAVAFMAISARSGHGFKQVLGL